MIEQLDGPPALILGGFGNSISIARSLAHRGVRVRSLTRSDWPMHGCRYTESIVLNKADFWAGAKAFLLGPESDYLAGSVLFATVTDEGLEMLIENLPELSKKFRIDRFNVDAQHRMLDKLMTYESAQEAGVVTPRFWTVHSDLRAIADEFEYPMMVKPRYSHLRAEFFGDKKYLLAENFDQLEAAVTAMNDAGMESLLMEMIPGDDDQLCSYYTHLGDDGVPAFDFTKRIIRRRTKNMGIATYHITDHVAGIAELANRLFAQVDLRGLANAEFKLDPRDGQYKLIECNARFTAATSVVAAAGIDLAEFVYRQAAGLPAMQVDGFRDGVRLWSPLRDLAASFQLRRNGELSIAGWLKSIAHRQNFDLFWWRDPGPALIGLGQWGSNRYQDLCRVLTRRRTAAPSRVNTSDPPPNATKSDVR